MTRQEQLEQRERESLYLMDAWQELLPGIRPPSKSQWHIWLQRFDPEALLYAIGEARRKNEKMDGTMTQVHAIRFTASVANRVLSEAGDEQTEQAA